MIEPNISRIASFFIAIARAMRPLPSSNEANDLRVRIVEATENQCGCLAEGFVQKRSAVDSKQVRAGVFKRHTLAFVLDFVRSGATRKPF